MGDEQPESPFRDWVQELQEQEGDIGRKIEIIDGIIDDFDFDDAATEQELKDRLDAAGEALKKAAEGILDHKFGDVEKELEDLEGFIDDPRRLNPQPPPPPWVWPWPWPPPPGFPGPGPGSPPPGLIAAGIVTSSDKRFKVVTASRSFIVARDEKRVWVWDPIALKWAAELSLSDPITALEQVDGTIAVRSENELWLFHPLDYRWLGPLTASILEVQSFDLGFPSVATVKEASTG